MVLEYLSYFWQHLTAIQVVWISSIAFTVVLLLLLQTGWGLSKPLRKCLALSILTHLLLAGIATTVPVLTGGTASKPDRVHVNRWELDPAEQVESATKETSDARPWDEFPSVAPPVPTLPTQADSPALSPHLAALTTPESFKLPELAPPVLANKVEAAPLLPKENAADLATESPAANTTAEQPVAAAVVPALAAPKLPAPVAAAAPEAAPKVVEAQRTEPSKPEPLVAQAATSPALLPGTNGAAAVPDSDLVRKPIEAMPTSEPAPAVVAVPAAAPKAVAEPTVEVAANPAKPVPLAAVAAPTTADAAPQLEVERSPLDHETAAAIAPDVAAPGTGPTAVAGLIPVQLPPRRLSEITDPIPAQYRLRLAPNRAQEIERFGGSAETEQAVDDALGWLAKAQSPDGRWVAKNFGAGQEHTVDGRNREGAGARADNGITGLALLAYLGAGHTHRSGLHQVTVERGIKYLIGQQHAEGHLAGDAQHYEFMYCHAMAAFALSEAYAISHDKALEEPVRRAVQYTLTSQDRFGGGWRYQPGDAGDTSVLGWQLMTLKSAELAGINVPVAARAGMARFLNNVATGRQRGLASYRVGEAPTRVMTAEALVCRQFLNLPTSDGARDEAIAALLADLPSPDRYNDYYWYYGTLAMHHLQGSAWERWNESLQNTLLPRQVTSGNNAGSWNPQGTWGGHGGRVYSTAMATLCLEVYYRYLPVYTEGDQALREVPLRR